MSIDCGTCGVVAVYDPGYGAFRCPRCRAVLLTDLLLLALKLGGADQSLPGSE